MSDFTMPDIPAGSTYEVYEYLPGMWNYVIHAPGVHDGRPEHVLLTHQSGGYVAKAPDGEETFYHRDGVRMDRSFYRTEVAAHDYCRSLGAICRTTYTEPHPDPTIAGYLASDIATIADAVKAIEA